MLELLNKYKVHLIILTALIWLCWVFFTKKPQMPVEYKQAIDSLIKANVILQQKQDHLDSSISDYQVQIYDLDFKLSNVKEKTTVIKEYYHEVSKQTQSYNSTQVDSFLRNRFNY